ncbi:MAG: hypothetical protein H6611_01485 [Ignavibacteriales bacterium]|nr:hypothetical protein [Ignavibacteriales bacterium]
MNRSSVSLLTIIFVLLISIGNYAQYIPGKERGDSGKRAKGQMEGNRIRTTIHNFGFTGRTGGEFPIYVQTPYEWPKNTGQVYLALTAIFIGGEVVDNTGTTIKIVDVPTYRSSPDGGSWNLEPTPGYYNDDRATREVASSADETTWPLFWPDRMNDKDDPGWEGSWNGLGGKNDFRADQEIFYRASDDLYSRYANYFPDSTDMTRKGMGILMDVRALAWSQFLVQDAIYVLHNIKNDGTKDIPKTAVTAWHADFVGGDGDSQDDISEFDLLVDIGFSYDNDHRSANFGSDPVGIIGQAFLETPGNSTDRIDNDGDGEEFGPKVSEAMLVGETVGDLIDNNLNGLIDENEAHIPFQDQEGVTYADRIDQNGNAESNSPIITTEMVNAAAGDQWKRWPANPAADKIHLIMVESDDVGYAFADFIDNDDNGEEDSPVITQEMINQAANDAPYYRVTVANGIVLYDVKAEDLGKKYADGIDNDNNGAVDELIDEGIDEMVDESRDNGIDDEGDWNVLTDDVGLDGVPDTGDEGEGDGKPTSGARFGLPGEPSIDVTDVSETDQIGITNAQYDAAGSWDFNSVADEVTWFRLMRPGRFYDPLEVVAGEYDLFISSGFFPLKSGQSEPISVSVILANGPAQDPDAIIRKAEIIRKKVRVQETYENDYQFANAPITPNLTAVAGDNRVTLYWDNIAETSFDTYINNIGGNGFDFEGYKIYRAQDPAFQDAENITSGFGIETFKTPLAIFDKVDNYFGFDSVGINGVNYYLGDNTGLQHSYVDTTVKNGFTYYYALVSYDFGYPQGEILPTESPIKISLQSDGSVITGQNVVKISPEASTAGYIKPTLGEIKRVQGTTTSKVTYNIIDELKVKENHTYTISFEDTIKVGEPPKPDTLTTKNFTLVDETDNVVLIDKSTNLSSDYEQPIVDGFRLIFNNEAKVELDIENSGWNNEGIMNYVFEKLITQTEKGEQRPNDYIIIFGEVGVGTSKEFVLSNNTFPSQPVNFQVFNKSSQSFINFGFVDIEKADGAGILSAKGATRDRIVFLEEDQNGVEKKTWWFYLSGANPNGERFPTAGDSVYINLKKPFLSADKFTFTTSAGKTDIDLAKEDLDNIKVVPNPYVASAKWEIKNPYNTGRGPRSLHFTHLPSKCTIRIFTVNGELVNTLYHDSELNNGTYDWDMLTKDRLAISYGVYIYQVEAPGIGDKIGKFAIIK